MTSNNNIITSTPTIKKKRPNPPTVNIINIKAAPTVVSNESSDEVEPEQIVQHHQQQQIPQEQIQHHQVQHQVSYIDNNIAVKEEAWQNLTEGIDISANEYVDQQCKLDCFIAIVFK